MTEFSSPGGAGPRRVALVADSFLPRLGGIELHLADLARTLRAQGFGVAVLTATPGSADHDGIPVRRLTVAPSLVGTLRRALAEGGFDVVHAHASVVSPVAWAAVAAARGLGLPAVLTFHSMLLAARPAVRLSDVLLGWSRWPVLLTAVSSRVVGQIRRAVPRAEVELLPNGFDPALWAGGATGERRSVVAVTAMRLVRKKRPRALLDAFRAARAEAALQQRALTLRIAGDGPARPMMERMIRRHGLHSAVELLGAVPRPALAALYREADLFVLASRREAFGLAALEARGAGLPVLAMRASGAVDFLRDGETALLAADDAALARNWARLALDDGLRRRLAGAGSEVDRFAWGVVGAAHARCYAKAAQLLA